MMKNYSDSLTITDLQSSGANEGITLEFTEAAKFDDVILLCMEAGPGCFMTNISSQLPEISQWILKTDIYCAVSFSMVFT